MTARIVAATIYDFTRCPHCGAIPDTPCHDIRGRLVNTHSQRMDRYHEDHLRPLILTTSKQECI